MNSLGRLQGKTAVITGGANGIGRATSNVFARNGAKVVVADIAELAGEQTVRAITSSGGDAVFCRLDASSRADNEAAMNYAVERFGSLDILVTSAGINNAGVNQDVSVASSFLSADPVSDFIAVPQEEWSRVINVNLTGTLHAIQYAAEKMRERGGAIVTIASIASKLPHGGQLSYCVSKAGVWMLTKWAAKALVSAGIRVNAVGPGVTDTNFASSIHNHPELYDLAIGQIPMKRLASPEEIANGVLFLASDEASYVTGEMLHVDGGFYTD
jgi:NAD(P)-dependent dehydrogenase (short-subunit alcohol dehydrogenase family)